MGREELQLLSLVEEIRALQFRLDKTVNSEDAKTSLYLQLKNGTTMSLYAVNVNLGRFGININDYDGGIYVEWALENEALLKGDRIIECNGKLINTQSKENIQKINDSNGRCELVIIRKKNAQQHNHLLLQTQEDNQRLQHRISYLEDQVRELKQSTKDIVTASPQNVCPNPNKKPQTKQNIIKDDHHVTSINISSSNDKPQVFRRGNFVATIIGSKAIQTTPKPTQAKTSDTSSIHSSKTAIKDIIECSTSNSDYNLNYSVQRGLHHSQSQHYIGSNSNKIYDSSFDSNDTSQTLMKQKVKPLDQLRENHMMKRGNSHRLKSHPDLLCDDVS